VKGKGGYTVTYDNRSFIVNGTRTLLLSGSVHYPRSTPAMWDDILQKMVQDGLNMVEIYIFWNLHEFKQGQEYNFAGSANWILFVEKAAGFGLFVNLRIGPYVCAEWNYGKMGDSCGCDQLWLLFVHVLCGSQCVLVWMNARPSMQPSGNPWSSLKLVTSSLQLLLPDCVHV